MNPEANFKHIIFIYIFTIQYFGTWFNKPYLLHKKPSKQTLQAGLVLT